MGKLTAFMLFGVATGCQMYQGPSESLPKLRKIPHEAVPQVEPVIAYVDTCPTNFRSDPTGISIDRRRATELVFTGDTAIHQAQKTSNPQTSTPLVVAGIESYRNALVKDPYDAEATLKLALAYDQVYRRGCALKLLARIATLESHPKFKVSAGRVVASVTSRPDWFKGYRRDAINVVTGVTPPPFP